MKSDNTSEFLPARLVGTRPGDMEDHNGGNQNGNEENNRRRAERIADQRLSSFHGRQATAQLLRERDQIPNPNYSISLVREFAEGLLCDHLAEIIEKTKRSQPGIRTGNRQAPKTRRKAA